MKSNFWKYFAGILVLVVLVGSYGLLMPRGTKESKSEEPLPALGNSTSKTPAENKSESATTDSLNVADNTTTKDKTKTTDASVDSGTNPSGATPIVKFTRTTVEGSPVMVSVRALVEKVTSGKCELTATLDSEKVVKVGTIKADATTYVCDGLDTPINDFSKGGEWLMTLVATSGDKSSVPITQKLTLEK